MDTAFVYVYECRNCQRIYPRVAGQPLACPFCQSKEREEIENGVPTLELLDVLMGEVNPSRLKDILSQLSTCGECNQKGDKCICGEEGICT